MNSNTHMRQYIEKITCWLEQKDFKPEVSDCVIRVIICKDNGYANPLLIFDKDSIFINIVHSKPISRKNRERLSEQFALLNIEGVSYAYGFDKFDKALMYADLLPISGCDADSDERLDEFCQQAFIIAPQILDDITVSIGESF